MHYYNFNIGDYRRDTAHLSRLEHSIYRDLIDWYYLDESPIPTETQMVIRRLRLGTQDEFEALGNVLKDFFFRTDDGYHHHRIDHDIAEYARIRSRNKKNGKKGGRPKGAPVNEENPVGYSSVTSGNPKATQNNPNQEPITNNQEPILNTKSKTIPPAKRSVVQFPDEIPDQLAQDFTALRKSKRAPITKTALAGIAREAEKAGITLTAALEMCCQRGWTGFKSDWVNNKPDKKPRKFDPVAFVNKDRRRDDEPITIDGERMA